MEDVETSALSNEPRIREIRRTRRTIQMTTGSCSWGSPTSREIETIDSECEERMRVGALDGLEPKALTSLTSSNFYLGISHAIPFGTRYIRHKVLHSEIQEEWIYRLNREKPGVRQSVLKAIFLGARTV